MKGIVSFTKAVQKMKTHPSQDKALISLLIAGLAFLGLTRPVVSCGGGTLWLAIPNLLLWLLLTLAIIAMLHFSGVVDKLLHRLTKVLKLPLKVLIYVVVTLVVLVVCLGAVWASCMGHDRSLPSPGFGYDFKVASLKYEIAAKGGFVTQEVNLDYQVTNIRVASDQKTVLLDLPIPAMTSADVSIETVNINKIPATDYRYDSTYRSVAIRPKNALHLGDVISVQYHAKESYNQNQQNLIVPIWSHESSYMVSPPQEIVIKVSGAADSTGVQACQQLNITYVTRGAITCKLVNTNTNTYIAKLGYLPENDSPDIFTPQVNIVLSAGK